MAGIITISPVGAPSDGITFLGDGAAGWVFEGLTDWLSLTDSKAAASPRPTYHGSFNPGKPWRQAATPSFKASFLGDSPEEALAGLRDLSGLAAYDDLTMTVDVGDGPKTRLVKLKPIDVDDTHYSEVVEATVYLYAPDPLAYGPEQVASTGVPVPGLGIDDPIDDPIDEEGGGNLGRVEITNTGNAPTTVIIDVAGGLAAVQVQVIETGEVLRLDRPIPDGSTVRFDSRTGRATLDGQSDLTGWMTQDQWPIVPAGALRTFQFLPLGATTGTPVMTVRSKPAWF